MSTRQSIVLPAIITLMVYILLNKFFPAKLSNLNSETDLMGEDLEKAKVFQNRIKKIRNGRNFKIALLTAFATAGVFYFNKEMEQLLLDNVVSQICTEKVEGKLKVVCDIVNKHDLNLHNKAVRELIIADNLSRPEKVKLLKIKLDYIINGEFGGKKKFLVVSILAAIFAFTVSGVTGLALFLDALYQLFNEGKISRALLDEVIAIVSKKYNTTVEYIG